MVLHGKERLLRMPQALYRPVVQVEMGDFRPLLQRIDIDTETMILRRNLNPPGCEVHHRLVAPVMAEFELISLSTQGQTQNLVSQTDTEQGDFSHQSGDIVLSIGHRIRVARTVRQENAIRLEAQDFCRRRVGRHNPHPTARLNQMAQDVELHAKIVGDHREARLGRMSRPLLAIAALQLPVALGPVVRLATGHLFDQITPDQVWGGLRFFHQTLGIEVTGRDHALLGAAIANAADERTGINTLNAHDVMLAHIGGQTLLRPPVAGPLPVFLDHKAFHKGLAGFDIFGIDPDIADLGIGHGNDLTLIGGIGENLLIAGQRGVEDDLADRFSLSAESAPLEDRPIGEG